MAGVVHAVVILFVGVGRRRFVGGWACISQRVIVLVVVGRGVAGLGLVVVVGVGVSGCSRCRRCMR